MAQVLRETSRGFASANLATTTVSNTTTETTLFSQNIPAGSFGLNKELRFLAVNTLTTGLLPPTLTIKIYLGSLVLTPLSGVALTGSLGGTTPFLIEGMIAANASAAVQVAWAKVMQNTTNILGLGTSGSNMVYADTTIDTTVDQLFKITATFGSGVATTSLIYRHGMIELT